MCTKRASAHTFNNLALANIAEEELRRPLVRCQLIPHLLQSLCTRTPHVTTIYEHPYLSSIYAYVYLSIHLSIYILCVCIYIRTDIRTYTYMLGGLLLFLLPHTHRRKFSTHAHTRTYTYTLASKSNASPLHAFVVCSLYCLFQLCG
jgi:hypothetical protein